MNKANCAVCNAEIHLTQNYCSNCGQALSPLAIQREELKLQNAGLLKIASLTKFTNNVEVKKVIKEFLEKQ